MVIPFQAVEVYLDNVVPADSKYCLKIRYDNYPNCYRNLPSDISIIIHPMFEEIRFFEVRYNIIKILY